MDNLLEALKIGGVGMGVVFLTLVMLTLVIIGLTRYFPQGKTSNEKGQDAAMTSPAVGGARSEERKLAAAIGVSLALALTPKESDGVHAHGAARGSIWRLQGREDQMRSREVK